MNNHGYERYLLEHKKEKAQEALDTAKDKLQARMDARRHINEPSGYSVKRWADSVWMHEHRVADVQHEINRLELNGKTEAPALS